MGKVIKIDEIEAYLARPDGLPKAGVLVIHEVWGLTDHIKSVADRLASVGCLALAPDLLADSGVDLAALGDLEDGLFDPARRNEVQPKLRELMAPMANPGFGETVLGKLEDCFEFLYKLAETEQKVAVIGFCFGGTYSFSLAVNEPRLKAAIPFYGHAEFSTEKLGQITCPVTAFYGKNDDGLKEQMSQLPSKMRTARVDYEQKIYPDCGHAFFNDTNRFAYNEAAASDAWTRVLAELAKL